MASQCHLDKDCLIVTKWLRMSDHAQRLLHEARSATSLDDVGDDSFREGLELLTRSLDREAGLSEAGRQALDAQIVGLLVQRLQIEEWYRRHPEIDEQPIVDPLVIVGLPRTGSTALSFLLAEDPDARSLRRWESAEPCPPPSTVTGVDPRIARAEAAVEATMAAAPRIAALVPSTATGPYECQELMALDFKSQMFVASARIPSYASWLLHDADLAPTYRYERRVLRLLQWGSPAKPWRLKCPTHLLYLEQLDEVFPDARFVMTHRDPLEVIVSVADLYAEVGSLFADQIDRDYIGALNVEQWAAGLERAVAFRDGGAESRFYDVDFRTVQRDPIGTVRGLYDWLGAPVIEEFETGMRRWWRANAEAREQNVHPDPADFGLDSDRLRPRFAEYCARVVGWTDGEERTP